MFNQFKPSSFGHKNSSNTGDKYSVSINGSRKSFGMKELSAENGCVQRLPLEEENSLEEGCGDDGELSILMFWVGERLFEVMIFSSYKPYGQKISSNTGDIYSVSINGCSRKSLDTKEQSVRNGCVQKLSLVSSYASVLVATAVSLEMEEDPLEDDGELSMIWEVVGFRRELFCCFTLFCLFSRGARLFELCFSSCGTEFCCSTRFLRFVCQ